ncbi:hypothetical protein D9757_002199 [Collybiopsis confluens]|uniref:Cyclochlorotine biosynthesis protein O n=1 Tax=Collybiopsis confluens TaxID=2823264 RepID=A0A8H5MFG6_9AGAR|nr:hypothetical protein D9757_002199 [Collybiopsis confluens]
MPSATYLPLYEDHDGKTNKTSRRLSSSMFLSCLLGSLILNILLAMTLWTQPAKTPDAPNPQTLYSPAQDVIEYKNVKFHSGFGGDLPVYDRPPSPEVDAAWDGLYEFALTKVPRYQASLIANKTWPILGETGQYMVALDVFHQLHCLNEMRKAMYPEYYPITGEGIHTPHMRHCISSLRQSIMCSADVTPIVWQWSEKSKAAKERSDVVHTCRNFDTIKEWARERFVPRQQNMSIYIEDDLDIATLY